MDSIKAQERIKAKADKYKNQGFADKEFRKDLNNKKIVMMLPNNVFEQHRLLNLAEEIFAQRLNLEDMTNLEEKYLKEIAKYTLIDGQEFANILGQKDAELAHLETYGILYYMELLAPLSAWRDIVAEEMFS
jgi:hypothetical protein